MLERLLGQSGCELTMEEVVSEFACALEEGTQASEIIPLLWELEPRFASPAEARRTFANLFGLWDDLAQEAMGDLVQIPGLDPSAPLTPAFTDHAWRRLEQTAEADVQRDRDRFENSQSDVGAFVCEQTSNLGEVATESALELAFETWWLLREARGEIPAATRAVLAAAHAEPDDPDSEPEPALGDLVSVTLWEQAAEDERPLPEEAIPAVERLLRAVRRVLARRA